MRCDVLMTVEEFLFPARQRQGPYYVLTFDVWNIRHSRLSSAARRAVRQELRSGNVPFGRLSSEAKRLRTCTTGVTITSE